MVDDTPQEEDVATVDLGVQVRTRVRIGAMLRSQPRPNSKIKSIELARRASDYVTVTKFLFSHIREKYTKGGAEIAWALENEEEHDFSQDEPTMKIVTPRGETPTYEEEMQQKQHQLKYQQQLSSYTEKIETYNNNRERAYGLLSDSSEEE